ncbi:MAG: DUF374 domain-containing protein [Deltaproteobacteria bacterium]|nr:DUF374 domain-containing protein [Candidatus Zymogenaceae bacterium]
MKYPSEEFRSLVGYSEKYGVHLGPYEDSRFSFSYRLLFRLGVPFGVCFVTPGYSMSRVGIVGGGLNEEMLSGKRGIIYAYWHRYAQYYYFWARRRRHVMMISQREGGEYGARCMARVGVLAVRGSTSSLSRSGKIRDKKGREALAAMVGLVRDEGFHAGITVDGPKGPALTLKKGAVTLARDTGSPILVMTVAARPHVRLFNWDKMWMPVPLSRIVYFFTGPFWVPKDTDESEIEAIRIEIETHMRQMTDLTERYFADKSVRTGFPEPVWGPQR